MMQDIRWQQRFSNFCKALAEMRKFIDKGELSELEEQGLIKAFEYCFELAWNTLKDFFEYRGQTDIFGSRDAIRLAFQTGLIENGAAWMDMLASRNRTSHTYNQETAREVCQAVVTVYFPLFVRLQERLAALAGD